jgi:hypothetical protein
VGLNGRIYTVFASIMVKSYRYIESCSNAVSRILLFFEVIYHSCIPSEATFSSKHDKTAKMCQSIQTEDLTIVCELFEPLYKINLHKALLQKECLYVKNV